MSQGWIVAGGIHALVFALFHLLFWRLFNWKSELKRLSSLNRAVMQVLNLGLTWLLLLIGYISLFHAGELASSALGHALLAFIAAFWLFRAVEQAVFFGLRNAMSWVLLALFLAGAGCYLAPLRMPNGG